MCGVKDKLREKEDKYTGGWFMCLRHLDLDFDLIFAALFAFFFFLLGVCQYRIMDYDVHQFYFLFPKPNISTYNIFCPPYNYIRCLQNIFRTNLET